MDNAQDVAEPLAGPRWQIVAAASMVALSFVAYLITMYPDLTGGDSGELIGAVANGGVIHPPGYPLFFLLGKLFMHWPSGSLAWRMGLMSACCCACATGFLCLTVSRVARSVWAGIAAAGLFAFSPGVWEYAIRAEVFALNNLLVSLLLLLTVAYVQTLELRWGLWAAFVLGLGLSNHHTIVFVAIPLAAWIVWTGRTIPGKPRALGLLAMSLVAGLLPYFALPIAGRRVALVSWGATNSWAGFWSHVLRGEYGTFQLAVAGVGVDVPASSVIAAFFEDGVHQVGWWGIGLAAFGLAIGLRTGNSQLRGLCLALLAAIGLSVLLFACLANLPVSDPFHRGVVARFWQQPDLLLCVAAGFGLSAIRRYVSARWVTPVLAMSIVAWQAVSHTHDMDRHEDKAERSYAGEIMRVIPRDALVITRGDFITNSLRYLQVAEGQRPDVRVMDQELMGFKWGRTRFSALYPQIAIRGDRLGPTVNGGYSVKDVVAANISHVPIVVCGGFKFPDPSFAADYVLLPLGVCEQVYKPTQVPSIDAWLAQSEAALPQIEPRVLRLAADRPENFVFHDYWAAREMRAFALIKLTDRAPQRKRYLRLAANILREIAKNSPTPSPLVYKMLATAIGLSGLGTQEGQRAAADAWRQYLRVAPDSDPMLPAIRQELERLEQSRASALTR